MSQGTKKCIIKLEIREESNEGLGKHFTETDHAWTARTISCDACADLICMGACYLLTSRVGLGLWIYFPGLIFGLGASFMTAYKLWIKVIERERKKGEEEPPAFNSHN